MQTFEAQQLIFYALQNRGYTKGLTSDQLVARQVCKMVEEVLEAAEHVEGFAPWTRIAMRELLWRVRMEFDDKQRWIEQGGIKDVAKLKAELTDAAVTLANASEAFTWSEMDFNLPANDFDVMAEGVLKAEADIVRGERCQMKP